MSHRDTVRRVNPFRHELDGPPTPRASELPAPRDLEYDARVAETAARVAAARLRAEYAHTGIEISAMTPAELAGPLAMKAMRRLERGIDDLDPRVSFEAARVAVGAAPKVAELVGMGTPADADPEARRAALTAALMSEEALALVVELATVDGGPVRAALEAAGWQGPECA